MFARKAGKTKTLAYDLGSNHGLFNLSLVLDDNYPNDWEIQSPSGPLFVAIYIYIMWYVCVPPYIPTTCGWLHTPIVLLKSNVLFFTPILVGQLDSCTLQKSNAAIENPPNHLPSQLNGMVFGPVDPLISKNDASPLTDPSLHILQIFHHIRTIFLSKSPRSFRFLDKPKNVCWLNRTLWWTNIAMENHHF